MFLKRREKLEAVGVLQCGGGYSAEYLYQRTCLALTMLTGQFTVKLYASSVVTLYSLLITSSSPHRIQPQNRTRRRISSSCKPSRTNYWHTTLRSLFNTLMHLLLLSDPPLYQHSGHSTRKVMLKVGTLFFGLNSSDPPHRPYAYPSKYGKMASLRDLVFAWHGRSRFCGSWRSYTECSYPFP